MSISICENIERNTNDCICGVVLVPVRTQSYVFIEIFPVIWRTSVGTHHVQYTHAPDREHPISHTHKHTIRIEESSTHRACDSKTPWRSTCTHTKLAMISPWCAWMCVCMCAVVRAHTAHCIGVGVCVYRISGQPSIWFYGCFCGSLIAAVAAYITTASVLCEFRTHKPKMYH